MGKHEKGLFCNHGDRPGLRPSSSPVAHLRLMTGHPPMTIGSPLSPPNDIVNLWRDQQTTPGQQVTTAGAVGPKSKLEVSIVGGGGGDGGAGERGLRRGTKDGAAGLGGLLALIGQWAHQTAPSSPRHQIPALRPCPALPWGLAFRISSFKLPNTCSLDPISPALAPPRMIKFRTTKRGSKFSLPVPTQHSTLPPSFIHHALIQRPIIPAPPVT